MFEIALLDIRYALRSLRASPAFACVAILSLALGIGANTAIFSLIEAVMLRSLPVNHPRELVQILAGKQTHVSNLVWEQLRDRAEVFSRILAYGQWSFNIAPAGEVEVRKARGQYVSGEYFQSLGIGPALGRTLTASDDRRGCPAIAVLTHAFWEREYGARTDTIGRRISLDNHPFEIVGVSQSGFTGIEVGSAADLIIPLCTEPILNGPDGLLRRNDPNWGWLQVIGRRRGGVSEAQVAAHLRTIAADVFRATVGSTWSLEDREAHLRQSLDIVPAATGLSSVRRRYREPLLILMGIVAVVLLIACANVTNLLLARSAAREREIAIRIALGAQRARLVRQLFTETLLISGAGAALGMLLAQWTARALVTFLNVQLDLALNLHVLGFTAGAAVLTATLFGIAPALPSNSIQPEATMRASGRGVVQGGSRFGLAQGLVVLQVALSVLLVIGAGLTISTFRNLMTAPAGLDWSGVLLAAVDVSNRNPADRRAAFDQMLEKIRSNPRVEAVGIANIVPLCGCRATVNVVVGEDGTMPRNGSTVLFNKVSDSYLTALGTRILAGRDFNQLDFPSSPPVALINRTMAVQLFGTPHPLGRSFRIQDGVSFGPPYEVIGIVEDSKYGTLRDQMAPTVYLTRNQDAKGLAIVHFAIKRAGAAAMSLASDVKAAILSTDNNVSIEFTTLQTRIDRSLAREQLLGALATVFGGVALLLMVIGLYGVMAHRVSKRRTEIGVRLALGAQKAQVARMVMGEATVLLIAGACLGLGAAAYGTRFLASVLYGVEPNDPHTFFVAVTVLMITGLFAAYVPARRASATDPLKALREE